MLCIEACPMLTNLVLECKGIKLVVHDLPQLARQLQSCTLDFVDCCSGVQGSVKELESYREVRQSRMLIYRKYHPYWYSIGSFASALALQGDCLGSRTCVHCLVRQGLLPRDAWRPWRDMQAGASECRIELHSLPVPACLGDEAAHFESLT